MALRAGYYGLKRRFKDKLESIALAWDETISSLFPRLEQKNLSARNILPVEYKDGKGKVDGDLTWTVLSDGSIKANGSTSGTQSVFWLTDNMSYTEALKLSGAPEGASSTKYCFGGTYIGAEVKKDIPKNTTFSVACVVKANQNVENIIFKPLLKLASDPSDEFTPPTLTNRQLTLLNILYDYTSECTGETGLELLKAWRVGRVAYITYLGASAVHADNEQLITLPLALKPANLMYFEASIPQTGDLVLMKIVPGSSAPYGVISVQKISTGTNAGRIAFTISYIVSDEIPPLTRSAAPDTRSVEEIVEAPEEVEEQPVKKTTRKKSTAKAETSKEV